MKKHGNSGVVKAKFRTNLVRMLPDFSLVELTENEQLSDICVRVFVLLQPPKTIGGRVRIMLYPSNI